MDPTTALATVEELFGGLVRSDELVSKLGPLGPDITTPGQTSRIKPTPPPPLTHNLPPDANFQRRQAQVGLASNVVGIGAGTVAAGAAAKRLRRVGQDVSAGKAPEPGMIGAKVLRMTAKATNPDIQRAGKILTSPKAVAIGAGAALGLQGAALAGDAVANRVLGRASRRRAAQQQGVAKAASPVKMVRARFVRMNGERAYRKATKAITPAQRRRTAHEIADQYRTRTLIGAAGVGAAGGGLVGYGFGAAPPGKVVPTKDELVGKAYVDDVVWTGTISKRNDEKRQVFGWANVSEVNGRPVVDRQGDYVPIDEMEGAAYDYVIRSRQGGDMHERVGSQGEGSRPLKVSDLIESFIVTPDKLVKLGVPETVAKGIQTGWWVGYQISDDKTWELVKKGQRTGFSIHGKGQRVPVPGGPPAAPPPGVAEPFRVAKYLDPAQVRRKKGTQAKIALATSGIGLGALGVRGGSTVARRMGQVARAEKLERTSTGALTVGAGLSGVGGINFARIQHAESKEHPRRVVVGKAVYYDPEARRQKRAKVVVGATGAAAGGFAAAGAHQLAPRAKAVRSTYRATRAAGGNPRQALGAAYQGERQAAQLATKMPNPRYKPPRKRPVPVAGKRRKPVPKQVPVPKTRGLGTARRVLRELPQARGAAKIAAGTGLAAAAIAGERHRRATAASYRPAEWYRNT